MKRNKNKFYMLLFFITGISAVYSQSTVTFWTDQKGFGEIKIYYNGSYAGTITRYYSSAPTCGAAGCVSVSVYGTDNTWSAKAEDGSEWTSSKVTLTSSCTTIRLYGTPRTTTSTRDDPTKEPRPEIPDLFAVAAVAAVAIVAIVAVAASTDAYFHKAESSLYNGYNFGFKNSMNRHIDVEYGAGFYNQGSGLMDITALKSAYIGNFYDKTLWTLDFNVVYNLFYRKYDEPVVNPYFGFGLSSFFNDENARTGFGCIAGFSVGLGNSKRVKLHARYKYLRNFQHDFTLINQFEVGISIKYQDGFFFQK